MKALAAKGNETIGNPIFEEVFIHELQERQGRSSP